MTDAEQQQLIDDHFLFDKPVSPLLLASGMARDWPDGRGIWCVPAPARLPRPRPCPCPCVLPAPGLRRRRRDGFGAAQASSQVTLPAQVLEGPGWWRPRPRDVRGGGQVVLASLLLPVPELALVVLLPACFPFLRGSARCWVTQALPVGVGRAGCLLSPLSGEGGFGAGIQRFPPGAALRLAA